MRFPNLPLALALGLLFAQAAGGADLLLRPVPQVMQPSPGPFKVTSETKIVVPKDWPAYVKVSAQELSSTIKEASGIEPEVAEPDKFAFKKGNIMVAPWEWFNGYVQWYDASPLGMNRPAPPEGYNIHTTPDYIALRGNSERGCFQGLQTLIQIARQTAKAADGSYSLPAVLIADWPDHNWRTLQLHLAHTGSPYDRGQHVYNPVTPAATLERAVRLAAYTKMTGLVVDVESGMTYDRQPENITEGITRNQKAKIKECVDLAKSLGLELVPKSNSSSGHDGWVIPYAWSLNGSDIYIEQLQDAYDEMLEVFRPSHFHVGLDEDTFPDLDGRPLRETAPHKQILLSDYEFLRRRGVTMEVWCDGVTQLQKDMGEVPRDVIVHPWMYGGNDFSGTKSYIDMGFRVLCSPWSCWHVENDQFFSMYAASLKSDKCLGMAGTFWYTVPEDDTDYRRCLVKAGMAFWSPNQAGNYPNDKSYYAPDYAGLPGDTLAKRQPKPLQAAEIPGLVALVTGPDGDHFAIEAAREELVAAGTASVAPILEAMAKTPQEISPWGEGTVRRIVREPFGDPAPMVKALETAAGSTGALRALALEMLAASGDAEFLEKQDAADPAVAYAMGVSKDKRFIAALLKVASAAGPAQNNALMALGKLGAADGLLSLKDAWKSFEDKARENYAHALAMQVSEAAIPVLGELCGDANWRVRFRAVVGLGPTKSAAAAPYLLKLLDDKNPAVFRTALYWSTDTFIMKPEQYFPKLEARLTLDENTEIVQPILHTLWLWWAQGVGQPLARHEDPEKRVNYEELSIWKDKALIDALSRMYAYKDSRLAMDAMDVMIKMGRPLDPQAILKGVNTFKIEDKQFFAERMRAQRIKGLEPVFKEMWKTNDRLLHNFILQYCGMVVSPETFEMAMTYLPQLPKEDEILRMVAVGALTAHVQKLDGTAKQAIPIMLDNYDKTGWESRMTIDAALCRVSGRKPLPEEQNPVFRDQEAYTKRLADWKDWWAKQAK